MKPEIIIGVDPGRHNQDMTATLNRLEQQGQYKDMSCILIIPCIGSVPVKVVSSWWNMYFPPNQKVIKMYPVGMEVGEAYSQCIEQILAHPDLSQYKYIMTLETDNIPQPDSAVQLLSTMEKNPKFACVGGLYYTKGEGESHRYGETSMTQFSTLDLSPPYKGKLSSVAEQVWASIYSAQIFFVMIDSGNPGSKRQRVSRKVVSHKTFISGVMLVNMDIDVL